MADRELPPIGAKVYAIGNPLGQFANTLSDGLVSGHREQGTVPSFPKMPTMIQTTAPISHGSSGGPLLGPDGNVVGVMTLTWDDVGGRNVNFAVPAAHVARLLHQSYADKSLTRLPLIREPAAVSYIKSGDAWLFSKREYDKAIADFNEAIRLDPDNALAYYKRGYAWSKKEEYDQAILDFDKAVRLEPKNPDYLVGRGEALADKKEYDKAIVDFNQAIHLDSTRAYAYSRRSNAWLEKKDYDRAIRDILEAVRLDQKDVYHFDQNLAYAYAQRGNAFVESKDYDRAIKDLTAADRLDKKLAHPLRFYEKSLASAYYKRGNARKSDPILSGPDQFRDANRKAIADYSEAIGLDPDNGGYYFSRGNTRSLLAITSGRAEDYDSAMLDFNRAIRLDPNDPSGYSGRGGVWLAKKDYDTAIRDLSQAIRLNSENPFDYSCRGEAWVGKRFYDNAIADFNQAMRLMPNYAQFYLIRGDAWLARKNYDQAIRDYDQAVRLDRELAPVVDQNRRIAWSRRIGK